MRLSRRDILAWLAMLISFALQLLASDAQGPHLVLSISTLVLLWWIQSRAYGFWDPATTYMAMSALYVVSPVAEVVLLGNALGFDAQRMAFLANAGTAYLVAASLAIAAVRVAPQSAAPSSGSTARLASELETTSAACIALCCVYVALVVSRYGLSIGGIERAELYAQEFLVLSLTRLALIVGLLYAFALAWRARDLEVSGTHRVLLWLYVAMAVFVGIDLLILGDRRMGITLFLAAAPLVLRRQPRLLHLVTLGGCAVALLLYSVVRNAPVSEWSSRFSGVDVLVQLSPAAAEFGVVAAVGGAIEDPYRLPADFPTYGDAFLQLLPRALLPDRPPAPSEWFVWHYFPDYAATGGSLAFSSVVEALGNGGLLGVAFAGLAAGALLAWIARRRVLGAPLGMCFATFVFVFSMRMELAAILRNVAYFVGMMTLFLSLGAIVWTLRARQARAGFAAGAEVGTHG
jgi:hypothetical protein